MKMLLTTDDVLNALGNNREAADLLGVRYNSITNWRTFGHFPPDTYVMIQEELEARGLTAPDHLWKMRNNKAQKPPTRKARAG